MTIPSARAAEAAGVDIVLVGDSGAMTVLGYPSTIAVSDRRDADAHARPCAAACETPFLVADLPFGSYEESDEQAVPPRYGSSRRPAATRSSSSVAARHVARARAIVQSGIPVMGHVGLTPQTSTALGGYRAQGRTPAGPSRIAADDAVALQEAGCFSIVFEAIPAAVSEELMRADRSAGDRDRRRAATDGQVLVFHDLLGICEGHGARFVQAVRGPQGADGRPASRQFAAEVRAAALPGSRAQILDRRDELAEFRANFPLTERNRSQKLTTWRKNTAPAARRNRLGCLEMARLAQVFTPRDRVYFELFEEAGQNILRAADLLDKMLSDFPDSKDLARENPRLRARGRPDHPRDHRPPQPYVRHPDRPRGHPRSCLRPGRHRRLHRGGR